MINLLFVDDEPKILDGLRRMLRNQRGQWDMRFLPAARAALAALADKKADVVISDMRMPEIDGVALLAEVELLYPATARIMLTGQSWHEAGLRLAGPSQIFLPKPCDGELLKQAVEQALALRRYLQRPELQDAIGRLRPNERLLPAYYEIRGELLLEEPCAAAIASVVASDAAFEKVFQRVLTIFTAPAPASGLGDMLAALKPDIFRPAVLAAAIWSMVIGEEAAFLEETGRLLCAALAVAELGLRVGGVHGLETETKAAVYLAGLLHNLGDVLAAALGTPENSCTITGYLLAEWGLPDILVEAVTYQEQPSLRPHPQSRALAALHVARRLAALPPEKWGVAAATLDRVFLEQQGLFVRPEAYWDFMDAPNEEKSGG